MDLIQKRTTLKSRRHEHGPPGQASIFGASFGLTVSSLFPLSNLYSRLWPEITLKNLSVWKSPGLPTAFRIKPVRMGSPARPRPPRPSPRWISLSPKQCALSHLAVIISPASSFACNGLGLPSFCVWQMAFFQRLVQMSLPLPQRPDPKQNLLLQSLDPPPWGHLVPKHIILLTINYSTLLDTAGSCFQLIEARAKTISYHLCFQRPRYTANALSVLEEIDVVMCKGTAHTAPQRWSQRKSPIYG